MDGRYGDEPSSMRTTVTPGRKMPEVMRCALYGRPFKKGDKSEDVVFEGIEGETHSLCLCLAIGRTDISWLLDRVHTIT